MSRYFLSVVVKAFVLVVIAAIVLYSQVKNRPNQLAAYYTNDPYDSQRGGVRHTCGCELPSTASQIRPNLTKPGQLNVCYDKGSVENEVHVLMYNAYSSAAEVIEPMLKKASLNNQKVNKKVEGYVVRQEAHELAGEMNLNLSVNIPQLYLNGYKPQEAVRDVPYLQSDDFVSFPSSFLRLGFIYVCNDCSAMSQNCSLDRVNDLLKHVTQGESWGNCYDWGLGPSCPYQSRYIAKCSLFPPAALPFNFAVQRFLEEFRKLPNIGSIYSLPKFHLPAYDILDTVSNSVSFQASVPYVNFSHYVRQNVTLSFVVLQKSSALWFSLLEYFPTLESNCSSLDKIGVCKGTSFCNVFTAGGLLNSHAAIIRSNDTYMDNYTWCKERLGVDTFDNADSVWTNFDIQDGLWDEALCMERNCVEAAPYLATWNMSQDQQTLNDSLNQFLYSSVLKDFWAQRAGVCTNNYYSVFQYSPLSSDTSNYSEILNSTMFLEAQCTNQSGIPVFCWLTGRYNFLRDDPAKGQFYRNLTPDEFMGPANRFVCFITTKQQFWVWLLSTLGILFGWMGTGMLLVQFVEWLVKRCRRGIRLQHELGQPGPAANTSGQDRPEHKDNQDREDREDREDHAVLMLNTFSSVFS